MTWITDNTGRRWVPHTPRLRRKPGRALRFAEIKVGDQLKCEPGADYFGRHLAVFYVVTDLWFDPVAGERDETSGRMVAIRRIDQFGEVVGRKRAHTLRGLASNGFHYAGRDYIGDCLARALAMRDGKVVALRRKRQ